MDLLSGYGDSEDEEERDNKRKAEDEGETEESSKKLKRITTTSPEHIDGQEKKDKKEDKREEKEKKKGEEEDDELPPLPDMFDNTIDDESKMYEDKSKHQGRVRSFKHVVGNYATYVHIPVPLEILKESRDALMEQGISECPDLVPQDEHHTYISIERISNRPVFRATITSFQECY